MGVFDDKRFEQLDWMSQITETIESNLNELLARLPERTTLDIDSIFSFVGGSSRNMYLSTGNVVQRLIDKERLGPVSWEDANLIKTCFKFEVEPDTIIDATTNTIKGSIALVKTKFSFEDEELQPMLGKDGLEALRLLDYGDSPALGRMNEIMDLLGGLDSHMRNRSARKKMGVIRSRLQDIFSKNEWRIRSAELANKIGFWIAAYIKTGNLAGLTNFCKLKVMTHSNMPIYSVQEEKL